MIVRLKRYKKTIAALVGVGAIWSQNVIASADPGVTAGEYRALALGVATVFGVYQLTNAPNED